MDHVYLVPSQFPGQIKDRYWIAPWPASQRGYGDVPHRAAGLKEPLYRLLIAPAEEECIEPGSIKASHPRLKMRGGAPLKGHAKGREPRDPNFVLASAQF